jgi:hypothetical protein
MANLQESVLDPLRMHDALRWDATDVTRAEGSNIERFSTPEGEEIGLCHPSSVLPFTFGDYVASITLAIQSLLIPNFKEALH